MRGLPILAAWTLGLGLPGLEVSTLAAQEHADTHPPVGIAQREQAGAVLFEATVAGPLLDWAAVKQGAGGYRLYLLAAPEETAGVHRALYEARLATGELVTVDDRLPVEIDALFAIDLDGDGEQELLVGRPGAIFRARLGEPGDGPVLDELFRGPGLDLGARLPVHGAAGGTPDLTLPIVGALRRFAGGEGSDEAQSRYPLPRRASRHRGGLRLTSPPSSRLGLSEGELYAIGPEPVGDRRLLSRLLPVADGGEERQVWSRLPAPERVQWSWFRVLDGRPVLIVTTNSADKLGVLERQRLRLFALYGDRTRSGVGPWLAAETTSRRWQRAEPRVLDVDLDGDDDLAVAQYDGLGGGKVKLEIFFNGGNRNFDPRSRSTVIDRPATAWHFGDDLTGDGIADLVLLAEGALEVYPGLGAASRRRVVSQRPAFIFEGADIPRSERSVEIGTGGVAIHDGDSRRLGVPGALDLDGDGDLELVLAENPRWGFGRLRVVHLPPR